ARIIDFEIGEHAHDFKSIGILGKVDAKVLAYRIVVWVEAFHEFLIDECYGLRSRGVLVCDSSTAENGDTDRIHKMNTDPVPRRATLRIGAWSRLPLLNDAVSPIVAFERTVQRYSNTTNTGRRREAVFHLAIKHG